MSGSRDLIVEIVWDGGGRDMMAFRAPDLAHLRTALQDGLVEARRVTVRWNGASSCYEVRPGDRFLVSSQAVLFVKLPRWAATDVWEWVGSQDPSGGGGQ